MPCVVTQLFIYPVKSLAGISLNSALLSVQGLPYDRQWMLIDSKGRFVTQRQCPALAAIKTRLTSDTLQLHANGHAPLQIPLQCIATRPMTVQVWQDQVQAYDEGEHAAQWLQQVLTSHWPRALRLVRFASDYCRPVSQKHLRTGESANTQFADGYPYLIANQGSLDEFNAALTAQGLPTVGMDRFRANIVVSGWQAWQENQIREARHPDYHLALRKPCQRCPMITVDQQTGERQTPSTEPLRALTQLATLGNEQAGAYFGQNAILLAGEGNTIHIGDCWQSDSN